MICSHAVQHMVFGVLRDCCHRRRQSWVVTQNKDGILSNTKLRRDTVQHKKKTGYSTSSTRCDAVKVDYIRAAVVHVQTNACWQQRNADIIAVQTGASGKYGMSFFGKSSWLHDPQSVSTTFRSRNSQSHAYIRMCMHTYTYTNVYAYLHMYAYTHTPAHTSYERLTGIQSCRHCKNTQPISVYSRPSISHTISAKRITVKIGHFSISIFLIIRGDNFNGSNLKGLILKSPASICTAVLQGTVCNEDRLQNTPHCIVRDPEKTTISTF